MGARASVFALLLGVLLCGLAPAATAQTITVTNTDDSGEGSLRKAVADITAGGTINFSQSLPAGATITLNSVITVEKNLTIDGRNVPGLTLSGRWDGTTSSTAPGNRIIILPNTSTPTVSINDLTMANGNPCNTGGGSAAGQPKCNGGAIYLEKGTLNLDRVTIRNSHANDGAAIKVQEGTLNATRSAFYDNEARDDGGAIDTGGGAANPTANLTNVTIANNKAGTTNSGGTGGAVRVDGIINLTYVTIYGNNADNDGALDVNGTANVRSSIVIGNTKYTNTTDNTGSAQSGCSGTVTDQGYNWQASGDGCGFGTTTGGNTTVAALKLATVPAFNSGRTETLSLEVGSSVEGDIPKSEADCGAGAGATDQRTINRGVSALGPNPGCEPGAYELQSLPAGSDSDGDGILDTDEDANSDGDPTDDDEDRDGRPNFIDLDADGDGLADDTEIGPTPSSPRNSDSDGIADYLDIDSDDDGIPDNIEAQATSAYTPPSAKDVDNDGLDDAYDQDTGSSTLAASVGLTPVNTDGDATPDYRDLDSDDDTVADATEGHDTDFDGTPDTTPAGTDADSDGLDDNFDVFDYSSVAAGPATTGDNAANGTTDVASDYPDVNSDGEPDWRDGDDDGIPNTVEDTNGNGDPSDDDADGDGIPNYLDLDADNDGLRDAVEAGATPATPVDTDQDGTADYLDLDADGDNLFDLNESNDDDRNGINDFVASPPAGYDAVADANRDGQIDLSGTGQFVDTDGNGLDDRYETDPAAEQDTDGDGRADYVDLDSDADGLLDSTEGGSNPSSPDDSDGDGTANYLDFDSDNDGLVDNLEAQAEGSYVAPSGDDVDGDGLNDVYDEDTASANSRTAAASQGLSPVNTDSGTGDTAPDYLDLDADGDTVVDLIEGNDANADGQNDHATNPPTGYDAVADANSDGQIDMTGTGAFIDNNANGLDDRYETARGGTEAAKQNTDAGTGDTARDWRDDDDDGDFILTKDETGDTSPTNGTPDYLEAGTLPVELAALEATTDGDAVTLSWQTSSEKGNAGFHVEMRRAGTSTFETLSFVAGAGSTTEATRYRHRTSDLDPGRYSFRLRQVDRDGSASYSAEVEAVVEMAEAFVLESAYPNPFNPQATVRFAVREAQPVRAVLYDVMGREVQVLFEGTAAAGQMQTVRIDGSELSSGMYLVRVAGRSFSRTQTITLVK